ncbi:coenzyme F390 synthetase [Candidatus Methanoperedens nitroreducens]|uniref:Coenzyme F390 synthetase n=1 Tax=Candidatus Methanoperedens nitratireducens TaxID=1392998 RepID=A0A062UXM1_9EURY|nr:phenylacetate--CoA ligase family protein [Candidatus Methanoperedens nitroreducens]KCZ71731.1 coenzyme F390 synthetase [Candidatus Methanoperedens nitroreducens]MDJ1422296.1 phenylacetate--CoA ligase family protein [Candidatus Methanoperedens sp.]
MNWRKPIIIGLLKLTGSEIPKTLEFIKSIEYKNKEEIKAIQRERLKTLLLHAYRNVPYYNRVLSESGVVIDGKINLDNFSKIPILTKDIIRKNFEELKSKDLNKRKWYFNTSGGSTGVPVKFIQDKEYLAKLMATKVYFPLVNGKNIGEKEIHLWGSERDILKGSTGYKAKFYNWLINRVLLNSFLMSEEKMENYVKIWNDFKPVYVWAYVDSIYEFSKFIDRNNFNIWSPRSIIVTSGTLHKDVRGFVEDVFKTKVINQYGSREVGDIAVECINQEGLHIFEYSQYLEVLNNDLEPVNIEEAGKIYVTNLDNYSMPLIRYDIGDMGIVSTKICSCGRGFSMLSEITGRVSDHFKRKDGTLVHGGYFRGLFYFKNWVNKFQIIQVDYNFIRIYIVLYGEKDENDLKDIENKIKAVMGESCKVEFNFVNEIKPSDSGKFLFTRSLIYQK